MFTCYWKRQTGNNCGKSNKREVLGGKRVSPASSDLVKGLENSRNPGEGLVEQWAGTG